MWIFIDFHDSFSYILIDGLKRFNKNISILKCDEDNLLKKIISINPTRIILSPGPGHPNEYKHIHSVLKHFSNIPILGICLGHQIISEYSGNPCILSGKPQHGKVTEIFINDERHPLFKDISIVERKIMHYHSLIIKQPDPHSDLKVLAVDDKNQIMIIEHKNLPFIGFQFHPESILTPCGLKLLKNWAEYYKEL